MGFNLMVEIKDDIPSYKKVKDYAKTANISVLPIFETDISTEIPPLKKILPSHRLYHLTIKLIVCSGR